MLHQSFFVGVGAGKRAFGVAEQLRLNQLLGQGSAVNFDEGLARAQRQEGFLDDMPYEVPHYLADYAMRNTHVPVGFWRCVNHTQNCFFRESFIDELAHAAGADPYRYRRNLIGAHKHADKLLGVLDAAAERAGWGTPLPAGLHQVGHDGDGFCFDNEGPAHRALIGPV